MNPGRIFLALVFQLIVFSAYSQISASKLSFKTLPTPWDEGLPFGNGMLGALIWQKDGKLRFSLDRADLWDQRPMNGLHRNEFSYAWVQQQVQKKDYKPVQEYFDKPYDNEPAPTKIPGAAIEIPFAAFGQPVRAEIYLRSAMGLVEWESGVNMKTFVSAVSDFGMFRVDGLDSAFHLQLVPPAYEGKPVKGGDIVGGDDLSRLGYKQGVVQTTDHSASYFQEGWNGFGYRVSVYWKKINDNSIEGIWRISSSTKANGEIPIDTSYLREQLKLGFKYHYSKHTVWWDSFWKKSSISVPDTLLMRQWQMEQYKFGSASRKGGPPISLQAVWTADNGRIPPWKGDFHHDLNTQLSYWPAYSGNHLDEAMVYLDHLDSNKANYKRYTKLYFGVEGLNVPGVTTLDGTEMGGWIQYSLSPTVGCWLAQHYYWQWKYSMDRDFLEKRAYPWVKETAEFITNITVLDANGKRKLPISASPEINDNSLSAWFNTNTNYDLSLMKFIYKTAAELANELGRKNESKKWNDLLKSFDDYSLSASNELMFASTLPYNVSHRHFSHLMAIHPLGLIKWEDGDKQKTIIKNSLKLLDSIGPANWCGYSYAWEANLKARAKDGPGAARALQIFAKAFCSPNSFHLNGDQTKSGYSTFTYRPFTLEGNFAFAAGLQEMLLQSYAGFIEIMPAVPESWRDVSFTTMRTEGAFLVDAKKVNGKINSIGVFATVDGILNLKLPEGKWKKTFTGKNAGLKEENGMLKVWLERGSRLEMVVE
ncbi:MAG TPA: hypothetical protein VK166_07105 [Chitinophagaceae bacterium]|nr:hypothetical protein [Chitinophagaceae bacterium]